MPSETHFYTLNSHVKRGASSWWSFVPNSVWGSIGTTTIGKAHPTVIFRFLFWMKLMLWLTLKVIKIKRLGFIEHWTKKNVNFYFFRPLMMTKLWSLQKKLSHIQIQLNSNEKKKLFPTLNNIRSVLKFFAKKRKKTWKYTVLFTSPWNRYDSCWLTWMSRVALSSLETHTGSRVKW